MDALNDPKINTVTWMSSSQVGKTEVLLNVIGYFVEHDPAPMMVLQPSQQPMAQAFSKDRIAPMFRDTPSLKGRLADPKGRDSGNTILHKSFPGGHLTIAGANSPASLASRPIRVLLADEIDRYPESAGSEGDPLSLAKRRTTTFWSRKIVQTSTPTVDGLSRIQAAFSEGDQRYFEVPCPHCDQFQVLRWSNVKFDMGENGKPDLDSVVYECSQCRQPIEHIEKRDMLAQGQWIARSESNGHASFHISALYSPWMTWREIVEEWQFSRGDHERMMTWTNTVLGETFKDQQKEIEPTALYRRREAYEVPESVLVVTCGVDVQDDRLEALTVGWGENEECWELEHRVFWGDSTLGAVWDDLRAWLRTSKYRTESRVIPIAACGIDSGHQTKMVYEFCRRVKGRVFCLKGVGGERPIVTASKSTGLRIFSVGVDSAKDIIFGRMEASDGPAAMHFSTRCDQSFFDQLTAEKAVYRKRKGFDVREWVKIRPRNEVLDLYVYNLATLYIVNPVLEQPEPPRDEPKKDVDFDRARRQRRAPTRRGFVNRW